VVPARPGVRYRYALKRVCQAKCDSVSETCDDDDIKISPERVKGEYPFTEEEK
jgi:hypothetical protein